MRARSVMERVNWLLLALVWQTRAFWAAPRPPLGPTRVSASREGFEVCVKNVAWKADEHAVKAALAHFGEIHDVRLQAHPNYTSSHRGYGFVTFRSQEAAERAMEEVDSASLMGRRLLCVPVARKPHKPASNRALLVRKLRTMTQREQVEACLQQLRPLQTASEYSTSIVALSRVRRARQAVELLEEMKQRELAPNLYCYSAAISACGKSGQWRRALALLRELRDERAIELNAVVWNAAISACEKAGELKSALKLLGEMEASGVEPDFVSYSTAISACGKAGDWERACALLDTMHAKVAAKGSGHAGSSIVVPYTLAISACARARQWEAALAILEAMPRRGIEPNTITFNAAITACEKGGQWERALALLDEMHARGTARDVTSFNAAISACEKCGQWERALALIDEIQDQGLEPDVVSFSAAMAACDKGGQWEHAVALLDKMRTHGLEPNVYSFNAVISACERAGEWERALAFLDRMEAQRVSPDIVSITTAIAACAKGGQHERVLSLVNGIGARGLKLDEISLNVAVSACESLGMHERSMQLYGEACEGQIIPSLSDHVLDLRKLPSAVAGVAMSWSLERLAQQHAHHAKQYEGELSIITGSGKLNDAGVAVVKAKVMSVLASSEYETLDVAEVEGNSGLLQISAASLATWLESRAPRGPLAA